MLISFQKVQFLQNLLVFQVIIIFNPYKNSTFAILKFAKIGLFIN